MNAPISLETHDLAALERIAEGRAWTVPQLTADRLLDMGLVQEVEVCVGSGAVLQLTPAGLSVVRSSDQ